MDSSHDTGLDWSQVIQSLSHWSQAVSGAGCSGDNLVFLGEDLVVYIVNNGREILASWSGNNNLLSTCSQMCRSLFLGSVETGALENYINIMLSPRNFCSVSLCINLDFLAVNGDGIFTSGYLFSVLVLTLRGIILEQVCEHFRAREVVDCNYFITLCIEHLTESETANTAKTIDSNFYCHLKNTP